MRFSLSSYNNTSHYYCGNTSCKGKRLIKYELNLQLEYETIDKEIDNFEITRDHSYQKYKQVFEDINNKPKNWSY